MGWPKLAFYQASISSFPSKNDGLNQTGILINWGIAPPIDQSHVWIHGMLASFLLYFQAVLKLIIFIYQLFTHYVTYTIDYFTAYDTTKSHFSFLLTPEKPLLCPLWHTPFLGMFGHWGLVQHQHLLHIGAISCPSRIHSSIIGNMVTMGGEGLFNTGCCCWRPQWWLVELS
jgi:hypothetical protein